MVMQRLRGRFDSAAIRSTSDFHFPETVPTRGMSRVSFEVFNNLDVAVSVYAKGSNNADGKNTNRLYPVGSEEYVNVPSGDSGFIGIEVATNDFAYYGLQVTAASSPSSGKVDVEWTTREERL